METIDVLNEFVDKVEGVSERMLVEADRPGMPSYIRTMAGELFKLARYYKDLGWEIDQGDDL